jgi:acyl carrier protein
MSVESARDALRQKILVLLSEVTGGSPGSDHIDAIEYLELVDKIETRFGVVIDLETDGSLTSVDKFSDLLLRHGVSA